MLLLTLNLSGLLGCASAVAEPNEPSSRPAARAPKLVLQITVDQLRGDLPMRFRDRLPPGGFRYFLEDGVHFVNAHYNHANTETAVGHSTLVTGATPARHGITGNDWFDRATGKYVYNTEDPAHHLIGKEPKAHEGVSPRNLLASTIGDELVLNTAGRSRVFSVSVKDRGAILPGGHLGKSFWFSRSSGEFVTSTFYYDAYPEWVAEWNARKFADRYRGKSWELAGDAATYQAKGMDDRPYEVALPPMGRTFPHAFGDDAYTYLRLTLSPMGDELTLDFAKALIEAERVGQGEGTDFMAVSFSSTDYVGHLFGPSSLEAEDNVLRLDRILADLLAYVDASVGLDETLIVLSADHGGPEAPEYVDELGLSAGRFAADHFQPGGPIAALLAKRFGRDDLLETHNHPYLYVDSVAVRDAGLSEQEVETFLAAEIVKLPGIAYAMTRSDLLAGRFADSPIQRQIRNNFNPGRSGNVHLVPEAYWFLHSTDEAQKMGLESIAAIHGSPWAYDTYVPVIFAGHGLKRATVSRRVGPHDIAPTIAAYLGIKPPSGAIGNPLPEVIDP
jgi:predicted AlkP superfamily pyrophosphatase or phosphodiesterase